MASTGWVNGDDIGKDSNQVVSADVQTKPVPKSNKVYAEGVATRNSKNVKLRDVLRKYDKDKDGVIDVDEIEDIVTDLIHDQNKVEMLKWVVGGVVCVLIILLLSQTLLTAWLLEISKETKVGDDNQLVAADGDGTVITEKPRFYVTVSDIPLLPITALNSLKQFSFATVDGALHNYAIAGTKVDTLNPGQVDLFFSSQKRLSISPTSAVLLEKDELTGTLTSVDVAVNDQSSVTSRRLEMLQAQETAEEDSDIFRRCSITAGVCYHTLDEIHQLHRGLQGGSGRRLDVLDDDEASSAVTYAEINAELDILSTDSFSSLTQASTFLQGILGANLTAASSEGTTSVYFVMKERCVNYAELADTCSVSPAPSVSDFSTDANLNDTSAFDTLRPYPGLQVEQKKWIFIDEIEYNKDAYTIQLKVRYSHDTLREFRRHVVMIDRYDAEHIVSYDEVTTVIDPANPLNTFDDPVTYITNYNEDVSLSTDDAGGEVLSRERRLQQVEDALHAHMRTKLRGFPSVFIHDAIIGHDLANLPEHVERRLADDGDDDSLGDVVSLESTLTTSNSNSLLDISNRTRALEEGIINSTTVSLLDNDILLGSVVSMPCQIINSTYSTDNQPADLAEPEASFGGLTITAVDGLIQWPTAADSVDIDEFNDVAIVQRALLQQWMDENDDPTAAETPLNATIDTSRRRLMMDIPDSGMSGPYTFKARSNKKTSAKMKVEAGIAGLREAIGDIKRANRKIEEWHTRRLAAHLAEDTSGMNMVAGRVVTDPNVMSSHRGLFSISVSKKFTDKLSAYIDDQITASINRFRQYVLDKTSVYNMAVDYYDNYPYEDLVRADCGEMHDQLTTLYNHIDNFVLDNQKAVNDNAELSLTYLGYTQELQDALTKLEQVAVVLAPTMPLISKLPYAGRVAKIFYDLYAQMVRSTVKPTNIVLARVNNRITSTGLQSKLRTIITKNTAVASKIMEIRGLLLEKANDLVKVDAVCPSVVGAVTAPACAAIATEVQTVNDQLDDFADDLAAFSEFLDQQFNPIIRISVTFLESSIWNVAEAVLDVVDIGFSAINTLLEYQIRACFPFICWRTRSVCSTVSYPCGVKTCSKNIFGKKIKYPCGTVYCSRSVCVNVPEPYTCNQCAQFSVEDIISGAMNALAPLEAALNTIMEAMAKALGISFPELEIPGVPDVDNLGAVDSLIVTHVDFDFPDDLTDALDAFETYLDALSAVPSC